MIRTAFAVALLASMLGTLLPASAQAPAAMAETARRVKLAMQASGDAERLAQSVLAMRPSIERDLKEGDPALLETLKATLDARFDQELIETTASEVMAAGIDESNIVAIEAWSTSPEMQRINKAVRESMSGDIKRREQIPPARRELLLGLADAMLLPLWVLERQKAWEFIADSMREFSATMQPLSAPMRGSSKPTTSAFMVEFWLAAALESFDDAAIERMRAFASTPAGKQYFESYALSMSASWKQGWLAGTVGELAAAVDAAALARERAPMTGSSAPVPPTPFPTDPGHPELASIPTDELLKAVDEAINQSWGAGKNEMVRAFLVEAERRAPDDARTQMLWGQFELVSRDGPRATGVGEVRISGFPAALLAPAETRLRRAVELDPALGDAHITLGRVAFHLGQDEKAAKYFAEGRKHPHDADWANVFETDLAYVKGDVARAIAGYTAALSSDNAVVRRHGENILGHVYEKAGRGDEFASAARAYMAAHKVGPDFRFALAYNLLSYGGDPDEALALIEPLPDDFSTVRQLLLRIAAEGVRSERGGDAAAAKRKILGMAQHYPGTPEALFEQLCPFRFSVQAAILFLDAAALPTLRPRLVGCAVVTHRFDLLASFKEQGLSLDAPVMPVSRAIPLVAAMEYGDAEAFEKLLELGADPAVAFPDGSLRDTLERLGTDYSKRMLAALDARDKRSPVKN